MEWTKIKPFGAGHYWFWSPFTHGGYPELRRIYTWEGKAYFVTGKDTRVPVENVYGWWMGPIELPQPPDVAMQNLSVRRSEK